MTEEVAAHAMAVVVEENLRLRQKVRQLELENEALTLDLRGVERSGEALARARRVLAAVTWCDALEEAQSLAQQGLEGGDYVSAPPPSSGTDTSAEGQQDTHPS